MPHVQGQARDTVVLFPPCLDEYITPDNPVRFIDAFVDQLDLQTLGFARVIAADTGRPAYHPGDLLKLYVYGYLNRVRSSRQLERETQRNVEVMWLLKKLTPDFKTIADFRARHPDAIQAVCREFTLLCKALDLFGGELVAIDGSKFRAVNSPKRNFTQTRLTKQLKQINGWIATYLRQLDGADASAPDTSCTAQDLRAKIERLRERQRRYQAIHRQLDTSGARQLSLSDPDSRSMPVGQGTDVAYNVQIAVDAKHHLIVAHDVTNAVTDQEQLVPMAQAAQATLGAEFLRVVTDKGYYDGDAVRQCEARGLTVYTAKPCTSANRQRGLFTKDDFVYEAEQDRYRCPAGSELTYRFSTVENGRPMRYYKTPACRTCLLKTQCTRNPEGRRITRAEYEDVLERMAQRVRDHPEILHLRQQVAEHPFGTLKRAMNQGYFLCRGLKKVNAEMSLSVMAYNLKRAINILGVPKLIVALHDWRTSVAHAFRSLIDRLTGQPRVLSQSFHTL